MWKYDDYTGDARTVDVHIRRLREKIERNPDEPEFIFTKWEGGLLFHRQRLSRLRRSCAAQCRCAGS